MEPNWALDDYDRNPYGRAFYEVFGRRLQRARLAAGLSLSSVADRMQPQRSRASISNIERGRQAVTLAMAAELAAIVGADLGKMVRPGKWMRIGRSEEEIDDE